MADTGQGKIVQALYNFKGSNNDELCFVKGDVITVTQVIEGGWWEGTLAGTTGWFPSNYVKEVRQDGRTGAISPTGRPDDRDLPMNKRESMLFYHNVVLQSLIDTERTLVSELLTLLQTYLRPLHIANILSSVEYTQLVGNLEEIYSLHVNLLSALDECTKLPVHHQRIGGEFMKTAPQLKTLYHKYCANHPRAVSVLQQRREELCKFMESQGVSPPGVMVLTTSLSKPFTRLDKYSNVLKELERHTDESHPDRGDTQRAISVYRDIAASCNEVRKQKEIEFEILNSNIKGWEGPDISQLGDVLNLAHVRIQSENGEKKERLLLLFPSVLVMLSVSTRMSGYQYEGNFPLSGMSVNSLEDSENYSHAFELTGSMVDSRIVTCSTNSEMVQMVEAIRLQIKQQNNPQVSAESLQRNWEELKKQQQLVEKEMHAQEEIKEKQVEKLRQLQMTLDNVHRRQSYQDSPSPRLVQDVGTDGGDHHLQQHPSLQNLHPQGVNRPSVQQPPDLLPQHKSLPQVHQHLIAPLPPPSDALSQMRQQHFERLQQMQQQIRHQQHHCMQMIPPPLLPLQPPLQPLLQPGLPSCHQMQMKHLQQMQNMHQHLNQLHSMSHDSLMRRAGRGDLMKPSQSEMLVVRNEERHMSQTQQELRHSQGEVRTETSMTEYSLNHVATIEDEPNHFRKPGTPLSTFEHRHSNSPHYGCYSNVDLSNPFPMPVDSKQRPYSVYEGFYSPSPEPWHEDSHLYRTHSSSDIDMPSLEESDISGSLSDLLAAGQSCSNLSTSEATELQFSDSEDENKSHYDTLPHQDVIMDDEVCVSGNAVGKGAYVRRNSCPDVFLDHTCDRHSFNSDFSGSSDYSEDNTSEITDTYSQSLESSCTEEANDLNPESDFVPDIEQVITPAERQQKYIDHDEKIDRVSQVIELSKAGSWSELSKSAITALLEEMDDSDRTEEEDENSIGSLLDSYQDDANVPNGDIILDVDVIEETDYDGDTDTFGRNPTKMEKDEKSDSTNNVNNNDVEEDDDDATLTGDSSSDCDSDVMKTVIRRENKKDIGVDPGTEAIYSPVIKRRGICDAEIASSQTSLSSVSHPKMPTVLQQQQPFKAKSTTWAMSCLRPCPPIRPSNLVRDDATKSPRIGRKSSVTRRKPERSYSEDECYAHRSIEDVKTLEDDAHLLKVIEAYCTSAKTRQTVNSLDLRKLRLTQSEDHGSLRANSSRERLLSPDLEEYALQALLDSPQMLIAEEEKIIVEEVKGNQTVVEEKTLVDTVYSLKDQVKELRTEHKRMRKDLEDEKRARKRLEGLLRKSLRSLVETTWEEGANTS